MGLTAKPSATDSPNLFRQLILDTELITIAAAVDKTAWDELIIGDLADHLGRPIEYCFVKCVDTALGVVRFRKPGEKVAIVFDQGTKADLEMYAGFYLAQSEKYSELAAIGFGRVSEVTPLQGADMIATETYQYMQEWLRDREKAVANAHFRDYLKRELSVGLVIDREEIQKVISRVREIFPVKGQPS